MDRRKPGQSRFTTQRSEGDEVEILSGVFEGRTTGTPVSMLVRNTDQRSRDYGEIAYSYRPGHADFTFDEKYGFRDYRGGGRSSGRETIGRVAAGAVAVKILGSLGVHVAAYAKEIGGIAVDPERFDLRRSSVLMTSSFPTPVGKRKSRTEAPKIWEVRVSRAIPRHLELLSLHLQLRRRRSPASPCRCHRKCPRTSRGTRASAGDRTPSSQAEESEVTMTTGVKERT